MSTISAASPVRRHRGVRTMLTTLLAVNAMLLVAALIIVLLFGPGTDPVHQPQPAPAPAPTVPR